MGLFDKIKDNAKTISMKAIDATREYDEDYQEPEAVQIVTPKQTVKQTAAPETDEADFIIDETEETTEPEIPKEKPVAKEPKEQEKDNKDTTRKSKVTEVSKEDHEKAEKEKRQAKAKQAAKERLVKTYTPSYKKEPADSKKKPEDKKEPVKKPTVPAKRQIGIVDIAPNKFQNPVKSSSYARERAALSVLASQRKLNGTVPIYVASHMNFKTRVFVNRVEYSGSFGKNILPIEQVAWVKLRAGGTGVIIETTEGKRVVMVVKPTERLAFADAILKVQAMQPKKGKFKDTRTIRIDQLEKFSEGIDEIEKLAKLYDKGILSQEEFDAKKKQILGL